MRRPSILRLLRKERSDESDLRTYLETYRSLLTTQLDVRRFAEEVEKLRDRNDSRVRASKRNELAYVYLYFSRLVRGEVEGGAEIEGIDRIFFLPLDLKERIAFVSHRKMEEEEPAPERDQAVFTFFQLPPKDLRWISAGPTGSDVDAVSLDLDEVDRLFPGLPAVIETEVGRPSGSLLIIRQTVPHTPACLLVITSLRGGSGSEKSFSEDDEKDLSALTRMFFQTYRSVRLASFTEAYRELVNDNLILPTQWSEIEATEKEKRIDAPEGMSIRSFAPFLCFFCDSLSRADVLPEMDNAFFFPLNSQVYYLYHNVAPAMRPKQNARLLVGHLNIEDEKRREVFQRIRFHLAGTKPSAQEETREDRCRRMYADALELLYTAASPDAGSEELQKSMGRVEKRITSYLTALGQQASPLLTAIEVALFGTVHWDEWGLDKMDERFLTYQGMASAPADESGLFGHTGSLLAITILVDHLPLGILFINSFLSGAFGEEDQRDIQAISRGYFQTFQTRMLADIVNEYQKLGSSLSVSALKRDKSLIPEQEDVREPLALYFDRMFQGFEDLEVGAFLAVDRDRLSVYQKSAGGGVAGRRVELRSGLERLNTGGQGTLGEVLAREIRNAPTDGATGPMGWFYRWALLRSLAPEHEVLAAYPLNDLPVRLFGAEEYVQSSSEPKLRSVLESACFEASILDEDFPFLRQLLRQVTGADLLRSHTGSVIALALFYDALPAGLILLCSSSFLAFTSRIEERDASMATRAFFLPLQMEAREDVIHAYQNILGEGSGQHQEFFDLARDFLIAMAESLPTMQAGLFFSLDRDVLVSVTVGPDRVSVPERWTGRALQDFGQASDYLEDELEGKIEKIESRARGLETPAEKGDPKAQSELRDADVLRLYLRGVLDLFQGSRNPKQYDLGRLVERIFDRTLPAELKDAPRPDVNSGLRSHIHVRAWSKCRFRETFSYLHRLFALEERDPMARRAAEIYEQHWKGVGALLAVLVLQEGLPMGIALLASPIEGSFTEHERIDVDRSARAFFSEGQVHLRDEIILAYRNIVRGMLSEAGAQEHIERLRDRNEKLRAALEDELAGYLAVFMDVMFEAFRADPPSTILFLPFTDQTLYVGQTGEESASWLSRLEKAGIEGIEPDLPAGTTWSGFIGDWLYDLYRDIQTLYRDIQTQKPGLPSEPPHSPSEILSVLRVDTDTALATFIFSGQRYDDPLQEGHRHAYLAPFRKILVGGASEREAGSLLVTALLYDNLPAAGLLVIHSPVPWRFTEQDRLDVESVSRAFFLTYRSVRLRREATRAARLKGMQDMLLGVTHRLKNDLEPTLGVIDSLRKIVHLDAEQILGEVRELERLGLLEAGELGIAQVKKRFELLRSVISDSSHVRRARPLQHLAEQFGKHVEDYKRRIPLRQARYRTEKVRLSLNDATPELLSPLGLSADRIITDLEETWIDVSDGLDEVLAIYAENAVKAVSDPSSETDTIHLWCLRNPENPDRIDLLFYDRVLIPQEKIRYIRDKEVIPTEVGGGSGTGLYNAGNLLKLNGDGEQKVDSNVQIRGTALWLTIRRLQIEPMEVGSDDLAENIERWREAVQRVAGGDSIEWGRPERLAPSRRVTLYEGSYVWRDEMMPILLQIFLQRHQNLMQKKKAPPSYHVSIRLLPAEDGGVVVELHDNTRSGFTMDYAPEEHQIDQFERNHNASSRIGPSGAVGSWFVAMQDRLSRHLGINLSFGKTADRYTSITLRVPPAPR